MGTFEPAAAWCAPEDVPAEMTFVAEAVPRATVGETAFAYLDCGVWAGDDRTSPARRCFALVCGRSVALCEFRVGERFEDLEGGPAAETARINKALRALSGRQRLDVQVLRFVAGKTAVEEPPLYVFLPDVQLPLATKMPDLDPDLVPDPRAATCLCCGPILQRIMYGQEAESQYRAYGCNLGRDPNGWFIGMTEHFHEPAFDLVTFLGRLQDLRRAMPFHLVQLGEMFEVWAGYSCCYQASGRSAMVMPRVVRGIGLRELVDYWRGVTIDDPIKRVLDSFSRFPEASRTMLGCERDPGPVPSAIQEEAIPRALDVPGVLFAERPPASFEDEPPIGLFALLEQNAMFLPWRRSLHPAGRALRLPVERWLEQAAAGAPFPVYVTAQSQVPCLTRIVLTAA
jgi:hypothetical protein